MWWLKALWGPAWGFAKGAVGRYVVAAVVAAVIAHFAQMWILNQKIDNRDQKIAQLKLKKDAFQVAYEVTTEALLDVKQINKGNIARLDAATEKAAHMAITLEAAETLFKVEIGKQADRLEKAHRDSPEWAETDVPAAVWDEVL